jgi:hypothetical protein
MGQMDALTALELEAARRRETVMEDLAAARRTRHARIAERPARRTEPTWLAATLSVLAVTRLVRG